MKELNDMTTLTCFSAYGRIYTTVELIMKDWNEGKDFRIYPAGPYCSNRDVKFMKEEGYTHVVLWGENRIATTIEL